MSTILHTASGFVGSIGGQLQNTTNRASNQLHITTNRIFPPQQREETIRKVQDFANQNPKLAAFLAIQGALVTLPIALFFTFAVATLLVSLTTCLLLGLLVALIVTFFAVGFALLFVVPTIFLASCSAAIIFVWGFVGYVVLRTLNDGEAPARRGTRVGDKLHGLTGGKLGSWIGNGASDAAGVTVKKTSEQNGHTASRDGQTTGDINGANAWDKKWSNHMKNDQRGPATGNSFEVLDVVS